MKRIVIRTQKEFDVLPKSFDEHTIIEIRSEPNTIITVRENRGLGVVVAHDSSRVVAWDYSRVVAHGSSSVEAYSLSTVEAFELTTLIVFSSLVVVKHLADRAVARLRDCEPEIERQDESALVIKESRELDISFETWLSRGYVVADGIRGKLISQKTVGNAEIYTVRLSILEDKETYVARVGNKYAHGETIEKAIEDLRYKIYDRDTDRFKNWQLKDSKTLDELIEAYRVITGACEFGVKEFISRQKDLPEKISISDAVKLTKGQYGSEKFAGFFGV